MCDPAQRVVEGTTDSPITFEGDAGITLQHGPDDNGDPIPDTTEFETTITVEVPEQP
jgi:hypothetical protein